MSKLIRRALYSSFTFITVLMVVNDPLFIIPSVKISSVLIGRYRRYRLARILLRSSILSIFLLSAPQMTLSSLAYQSNVVISRLSVDSVPKLTSEDINSFYNTNLVYDIFERFQNVVISAPKDLSGAPKTVTGGVIKTGFKAVNSAVFGGDMVDEVKNTHSVGVLASELRTHYFDVYVVSMKEKSYRPITWQRFCHAYFKFHTLTSPETERYKTFLKVILKPITCGIDLASLPEIEEKSGLSGSASAKIETEKYYKTERKVSNKSKSTGLPVIGPILKFAANIALDIYEGLSSIFSDYFLSATQGGFFNFVFSTIQFVLSAFIVFITSLGLFLNLKKAFIVLWVAASRFVRKVLNFFFDEDSSDKNDKRSPPDGKNRTTRK